MSVSWAFVTQPAPDDVLTLSAHTAACVTTVTLVLTAQRVSRTNTLIMVEVISTKYSDTICISVMAASYI